MKDLKDFKLKKEEVWVAILDGEPVKSGKRLACNNKGDISRSFTHGLSSNPESYLLSRYKEYGFNSAVNMRKSLEESGRLTFKKL